MVESNKTESVDSDITDKTNKIQAKSKKHQKIVKGQKYPQGLIFGTIYLSKFQN